LTIPLALPIADWVLSLEVGEHVPSMSEGMLIQNLHLHNCKGIIVSWGVLNQGGHSHINNHSNDYIIVIFESLGYTYDAIATAKFVNPASNFFWFVRLVMVFFANSQFVEHSDELGIWSK
jgi:hypothetical protein